MTNLQKTRVVLFALCGAVALTLVALVGLTGAWRQLVEPGQTGASIATASVGGPFKLTNQDGKPFDSSALAGKPYLIFFGFTHCPDVCPTTLFELSETLKSLGPEGKALPVVFVTVDPARDTPELLKTYLSSFDANLIGLTGSEEDLVPVVKAFRVYAKKVPLEKGDYTMDHTASVYLMDGKGRFVGTLSTQENAENRVKKIQNLIRNG